MKYISIPSVVSSFEGCKGKTQNKFWGVVAILKAINQKIIPAKPYVFGTADVSNWLEEIFSFDDTAKYYNSSAEWTVIFSNHWIKFLPEQMFSSKPNIYDVASWFFRTKAFDDDVTAEKLIGRFLDTLHLEKEEIEEWFNFENRDILFTETPYRNSEILPYLNHATSDPLTISFESPTFIKSHPGALGQAPFVQTLYANQATQKCLILTQLDFNDFYPISDTKKDMQLNLVNPLQQIFYGAPGTGKSHEIKKKTKDQKVVRTTFHPDSDYSTFVGAYKPVMDDVAQKVVPVVVNNGISLNQNEGTYKEKRITYKFIKQAFLKAYLGAWKLYSENPDTPAPQFLVIEEINRGNCAQIFGDIFQLLDRSDNGFSEYPIEADTDLRDTVRDAFSKEGEYPLAGELQIDDKVDKYTSNYDATLSEDVQEGRVLLLPKNLYIWATMNTSDQSLFPIDSAFKRRWEWKYIKIKEGRDENGNKLDWKVDVKMDEAGKLFSWWDFIQKINEIIASMTSSADKQLGYFFCCAKGDKIDEETFVSKVIFYLWNDVFKDYGFEDASLFRYTSKDNEGKETEKDLTFPDFYDEDGEKVNTERLTDFVKKVMNWKKTNEENS
ncbi:MAG: hypothetical protein IKX65_00015 [Prevotella sp.]|nr:hypothetical protein [Prevotella sp.]